MCRNCRYRRQYSAFSTARRFCHPAFYDTLALSFFRTLRLVDFRRQSSCKIGYRLQQFDVAPISLLASRLYETSFLHSAGETFLSPNRISIRLSPDAKYAVQLAIRNSAVGFSFGTLIEETAKEIAVAAVILSRLFDLVGDLQAVVEPIAKSVQHPV